MESLQPSEIKWVRREIPLDTSEHALLTTALTYLQENGWTDFVIETVSSNLYWFGYVGEVPVAFGAVSARPNNVHLDLIYVAPEWRRKGLASHIYKMCIDKAKDTQRSFSVGIHPDNLSSIRLVEKMGLVELCRYYRLP
jgi:GNAT superfamily N-acetyltransferase